MNPIFPPLPRPPGFPVNALAGFSGKIPYGTIIPYAGSIDRSGYTENYGEGSYWRNSGNLDVPENFSPEVINNTGWIACDGSLVSGIVFPGLFDAIGYLYGKGDKDFIFKVPDYRGYFFRGLAINGDQDPGLNSNPDPEDKRVESSQFGEKNGVGSTQQGDVQMHEHDYDHYPCETPKAPSQPPPPPVEVGTSQKKTVKTTGLYSSTGQKLTGNETRPKNIYVNYLIYSGLPVYSPVQKNF